MPKPGEAKLIVRGCAFAWRTSSSTDFTGSEG